MKKCFYHIVWITKYRKLFIYNRIKEYVKESLFIKANNIKIIIKEIEIMPEHVHLFISIKPTDVLSNVIKQLKGFSSYYTRKKLNLYKYKHFWGKGYYCESIGNISEKVIRKYIKNQWKNYS